MTLHCVCSCLFILTAASMLPSFQATSAIRYPKINGSESLNCDCPDHACQEVFWYRYLQTTKTFQFLMYVNSAGRELIGDNLNPSLFKGTVSNGPKVSYNLRIADLQREDAGFYSCMFKAKKIMPSGYYIKPGVNPPTLQPPTVKTEKPKRTSCNHCKHNRTTKGCESSVLWPGIGALLLLAIALAGTLYYFSRLPKKCRHRFTKTNPFR